MIKPTRYQKKKLKTGKLLNQRFRFKKDDVTEEQYQFTASMSELGKENLNGSVYNEHAFAPDDAMLDPNRPTWENYLGMKHNIQPLVATDHDQTKDAIIENSIKLLKSEQEIKDAFKAEEDVLIKAYNDRISDLAIELALIVADRIKSFKKRNVIMAKLTGEEYGYLEDSCWSTGEVTTFKYWPASWKFERTIGTNTIFEARFNHNTFELISYKTIFAYDPVNVVTRNMHTYGTETPEDLSAIVSIYEKAIEMVYNKGRK